MAKVAIILVSESNFPLAQTIRKDILNSRIYTKANIEDTIQVSSFRDTVKQLESQVEAFLFIGDMETCVQHIAPYIAQQTEFPAVINVDSTGKYAIAVFSGSEANTLTRRIAHILGAEAVITTQSENLNLWTLDTLGERFGWTIRTNTANLNYPIGSFVNKRPTALLLDVVNEGTRYMERTVPPHVNIFYKYSDLELRDYELLIAVTPFLYPEAGVQTIYYHPKVLHLGFSCKRNCHPEGVAEFIEAGLAGRNISVDSLKDISTVDLKKNELIMEALQTYFDGISVYNYSAEDLEDVEEPNPTQHHGVEIVTVGNVSEATALKTSRGGKLVMDKQKVVLQEGNNFTYAVAFERESMRQGHIEMVGAGPGDPDMVTMKGAYFIKAADLILYEGNLVPIEMTYSAREGAVVRNFTGMSAQEQFELMNLFYDEGKLIVRLYAGDPCLYSEIEDQIAFFDQYNMSYHITSGITSFQAAAALLETPFIIPGKIQTIVITRTQEKDKTPESEQLHLLARSHSTMCILMEPRLAEEVQQELLQEYPASTPVAICYKLTWKEEQVYRGTLDRLANMINDRNRDRIIMVIVGEAIGSRQGISRLYSRNFEYLFKKS